MIKSMNNYSAKSILAFLFVFIGFNLYSQDKFNIGLIGFYNFENLYDTINQDFVDDEEFTPLGTRRYTGEVYRHKLTKLDQVIGEMGVDISPDGIAILGVAEIENRSVLKDFSNQKRVKSRGYKAVHYDSRDARGVDVALLYNPKYFKVIKSEKIFIDLEEHGGGKTRDILYVYGLFMNEEIHILVGHWPSRRGSEEASMARRCVAAKTMRTKIDSIQSEDKTANIVVMGDLNDDPTSPSVVDCLKAAPEKHNAIDDVLFNPFGEFIKNGIGTLAYNDAWNLFDQIIVSNSMLNRERILFYDAAHIFKKNYMIQADGVYKGYPFRTYAGDVYQGGYSDHFPTYLVFKKRLLIK